MEVVESDPVPLDGEPDLTAAERLFVRRQIREAERAKWLLRKLRLLIPLGTALLAALYQAAEWAAKHVRFGP